MWSVKNRGDFDDIDREAAQHRQLVSHISLFPLSSTISTLSTNYEARLCCSSCHLGRCLPDQLFCSQGFGSSPRDQGACQKFPATIDLCSRQSQYVGIFLAMRGGLHAQQSCPVILLGCIYRKKWRNPANESCNCVLVPSLVHMYVFCRCHFLKDGRHVPRHSLLHPKSRRPLDTYK